MPEDLVPIEGCWVQRRGQPDRIGRVVQTRRNERYIELKVDWGEGLVDLAKLEDLECGLRPGFEVQDVPISTTRISLGPALVAGIRRLGGRQQALVQLNETGRSLWLPYENLRRIKDVHLRYVRAETGFADHAERFRLRLLAHALDSWNQVTGALDRLDVDPLPHQIHLVHRILTSGQPNWLIADDVGLGKTIEVGLLLAAMKRTGQARRVLVVTPAGLVRQWQDEMRFKFDQSYRIYGRDFFVNYPEEWKLYDHVIVSMDLAKQDQDLACVRASGGCDVVVFDEAHRLSRYASGERTQRYRLAATLRELTPAFFLLTATPHQGYVDRFIALLELVRPDLIPQIQTLEANPEVVSELILRNRKSEVTDLHGNFIFKGQRTHRVPIAPSPATAAFQRRLGEYLRRGYGAGQARGTAGRAIGFVMTTYRKLASSSIAAIERALQLRRERLLHQERQDDGRRWLSAQNDEDFVGGGDDQDDLAERSDGERIGEFFSHEIDLIDELLIAAETARRDDEKLRIFLNDVVAPLVGEGRKLLVFTEYRATQAYLKEALEARFPECGEVILIHGGLTLEEKLNSIQLFNRAAQLLVSTEAGGEGINLHRACHVMVNYDLPWNPSRLVQRIGRLYRYGQTHTVVVFNLHARDSFDNAAIDLMLDRVSQIVRDMSPVGSEFNDRLHTEILGDLLENIDLAGILQAATHLRIERTSSDIEEAISRARRAQQLQAEILAHVSGFDPRSLAGTLGMTMSHVDAFVRGMFPYLEIEIVGTSHRGRVLELRLPEEIRGRFPSFGQRTLVRVTTDRRLAQDVADAQLLDFENPFFKHMIERAKSSEFDGVYACVRGGVEGILAAFIARWQNDQGEPTTEELLPLYLAKGRIQANPPFLSDWLLGASESADITNGGAATERRDRFERLVMAANARLAAESTRFRHPNSLVAVAAADLIARSGL
jgi:superfamily II DNA or RNA helicase